MSQPMTTTAVRLTAVSRVTAILLLSVCIVTSQAAEAKLELVPVDPFLIEGQTLEMNCTQGKTKTRDLHTSSSHVINYTDQQLTFYYVRKRTTDWLPFNPIDYKGNGRKSRLKVANITMDWDNSQILCQRRDERFTAQALRVSKKIVKPTITDFVWYDWSTVTFHWLIDKSRDRVDFNDCCPINYTVSVRKINKLNGQSDGVVYFPDRNFGGKCTFTASNDDGERFLYEIQVTAQNSLESVSSGIRRYILLDYCKPKPVPRAMVDYNDCNGAVAFEPPKTIRCMKCNFRVDCPSTSSTINHTYETNISVVSTRSTPLPPTCLPAYTDCNLGVTCALFEFDNKSHVYRVWGFWSDLAIFSFKTRPAVPLSTPNTCASCYEEKMNDNDTRQITLYFKALTFEEQRGVCKGYRVTYWIVDYSSRNSISIGSNQTSLAVNLSTTTAYYVTVESETDNAGYNESIARQSLIKISTSNTQYTGRPIYLLKDTHTHTHTHTHKHTHTQTHTHTNTHTHTSKV
jgi:hypothetical protein